MNAALKLRDFSVIDLASRLSLSPQAGEGSFDAWSGRTSQDRIEIADVRVLNRTMTARSSPDTWAAVIGIPLPWLSELDPTLDLITTDDQTWEEAGAEQLVAACFVGLLGPRRKLSVATKMLHLKRPRLFPILDSLVAQMLGYSSPNDKSPSAQAEHGLRLLRHMREQGRRNLETLTTVQAELRGNGIERPLARILDATLWSAHPASGVQLRRVFKVGGPE